MTGQIRLAICTPGSNFSARFVAHYLQLLDHANARYQKVWKFFAQSTYLYQVRNGILGGDEDTPENFEPWNGRFDYTHILWIDSDMVFHPWMLDRLIDHDVDIVGGDYPRADLKRLTGAFLYESGERKDIIKYNSNALTPVEYIGFGFMLIKRGVHEKITYPWYDHMMLPSQTSPRKMVLSGEDVAFCHRAREAGFTVYADPLITQELGHEKLQVLYARDIRIPDDDSSRDGVSR